MKLLKNKTALSTVVTTLIILVVSVLLATVVTFYAINVTTTRVQEESLFLTKQHVWYNPTDEWAEAALVIVNTGGKDVVVDKITARGQECPWANVYYWKTSSTAISADLNVTTTQLTGATFNMSSTFTYTSENFTQASNDLTLMSGYTVVIYVNSPDSISVNDIGTTLGLTVFTANAQFYKETNVESS